MMNWRAIAVLKDGQEALLTLGDSLYQVSNLYQDAFHGILANSVKAQVASIESQKWIGNDKRGSWITYQTLYIPYSK